MFVMQNLMIECGLVLTGLLFAFSIPAAGSHWFEALERGFAKLARRRRLAVLMIGLAALALRAAWLPIRPVPEPAEHDEFSYLLAADTFSHGRLTNPPHPMWVHFETFHVIQQPTYASKYPPAQGLVLAVGQVIAGHPFWGVWLSAGLMCATICWMLQAWLPEGWALLGGFLTVVRVGAFSYWADSYWGGAVAATGGALVLGALPRIKLSPRVRDALLMGLGLAILANSRPYEGLVFSLPVAAVLIAWMVGKKRPALGLVARRVLAPLVLVLILTGCAMGYYFWRVTGNPFRMPYQVYEDAYDPTPLFVWQSPKLEPAYHHEVMRDFYARTAGPPFTVARSLGGFLGKTVDDTFELWLFYLGPLLTPPLLMAIFITLHAFSWGGISPGGRFLVVAGSVLLTGLALETHFLPHYAAPMTCLIFALILLGMRRFSRWEWRGEPTGLAIVRAVPSMCVALLLFGSAATALSPHPPNPWPLDRVRVLSQLQRESGRHLVIVHYSATHNFRHFRQEWVYNAADIDGSKVVWARDMGASGNQELIRYFKDRHVWVIEPDETPPRLSPYLVTAPSNCVPAVPSIQYDPRPATGAPGQSG